LYALNSQSFVFEGAVAREWYMWEKHLQESIRCDRNTRTQVWKFFVWNKACSSSEQRSSYINTCMLVTFFL